jgi:hypothetical protein
MGSLPLTQFPVWSGSLGSIDRIYIVPSSGNLSGTGGFQASLGQLPSFSGSFTPYQCTYANGLNDTTSFTTWGSSSAGSTLCLNASGYAVPYDPLLSGSPNILGVSVANTLSGQPANIVFAGVVQSTSFNFSGYLGKVLFGISSGGIGPTPTQSTGGCLQRVGLAVNGSGMRVNIDDQQLFIG